MQGHLRPGAIRYETPGNEIVSDWLPRYTDTPLEEFGRYILLTKRSRPRTYAG